MSTEKPLVSVVLPSYNGSDFLAESIESVLNQTLKDLELVIVDDCSTDSTLTIATAYAKRDNRVRVIHNEVNKKLPESLNVGFREVRGEFLTWTSDDNIFLPEALQCMSDALASNESTVMVCAGCDTIDAEGKRTGELRAYTEDTMIIEDTVGACFMYKREILSTVGEYDPSRFCVEDFDYWQRILFRYKHIGRIDETLYLYRYHGNSLTATKKRTVLQQRALLHKRNWPEIIRVYGCDPQKLCWAYFERRMAEHSMEEERTNLTRLVPELNYENEFNPDNEYMIFGAGEYGRAMRSFLGNKAVCFIDNNANIQGTEVCGLKVYSLNEAKNKYHDVEIILAVSVRSAYNVIRQLVVCGIDGFVTNYSILV